jgi:hypothetical protein
MFKGEEDMKVLRHIVPSPGMPRLRIKLASANSSPHFFAFSFSGGFKKGM